MSSPAGFGAKPRPQFSTIFITQDGLSWHYNIGNCGLSRSHWRAKPPWPLVYALVLHLKSISPRSGHGCTWQRDAIQLLLPPHLLWWWPHFHPHPLWWRPPHPYPQPKWRHRGQSQRRRFGDCCSGSTSTLSSVVVVGNVGNCPIVSSITKHDTHTPTHASRIFICNITLQCK